jgi:hypothetical protein
MSAAKRCIWADIGDSLKGPDSFAGARLNLDLAGVLCYGAYLHIQQGIGHYGRLEKAVEKHRKLLGGLTHLKGNQRADHIDRVIHSLGALEDHYGPVVMNFGTAIILLVSAAETYANDVAAIALQGADRDQFDKLTPIGKWLFLPRLMRLTFKPSVGEWPMQGFADLAKRRNQLIHAKPMRQPGLLTPPTFAEELGMSPDRMTKSMQSVRDLIREFSLSWRGSSGPDWLDPTRDSFRQPCFYLLNRGVPFRLGRAGMR